MITFLAEQAAEAQRTGVSCTLGWGRAAVKGSGSGGADARRVSYQAELVRTPGLLPSSLHRPLGLGLSCLPFLPLLPVGLPSSTPPPGASLISSLVSKEQFTK